MLFWDRRWSRVGGAQGAVPRGDARLLGGMRERGRDVDGGGSEGGFGVGAAVVAGHASADGGGGWCGSRGVHWEGRYGWDAGRGLGLLLLLLLAADAAVAGELLGGFCVGHVVLWDTAVRLSWLRSCALSWKDVRRTYVREGCVCVYVRM